MDPVTLFESTYSFIERRVMPDLNWATFAEVMRNRRAERRQPQEAYLDVFPALACQAAGGEPERAVPLAAAWLLSLLAGRIFDDWQDGEGDQQLWRQGGASEAASFGLFALGAANSALSHLQSECVVVLDLLRALGNALALSASAQAQLLNLESSTIEQYFAHIAAKTGMIFATGAWTGARLADPKAEAATLQALYNFGMNLGIALQIADDCVDLNMSDIHHQHFTLPVLYGLTQRDHPEYLRLKLLLKHGEPGELVSDVTETLTKMGAITWSMSVADVHRKKAIAALEPLPYEQIAPLIADETAFNAANS